jgi:hypothetical protein
MGKREDRAGRRNVITAKGTERVEKVKIFVRVNDLFTTFKEIVGSLATRSIYLKMSRVR